jgi:hypothetical protein
MYVDRTAARVGVTVAAVPVAANAAFTAVVAFRADLLVDLGREPVGRELLFWSPPLLILAAVAFAPFAACYLTFPEDRTAGPVVGGFTVAAVVLAAGVVGCWWAASVRPVWGTYPQLATWLALLFGGAAALGAVGGDTVGPLFRLPEGADEDHPRW